MYLAEVQSRTVHEPQRSSNLQTRQQYILQTKSKAIMITNLHSTATTAGGHRRCVVS